MLESLLPWRRSAQLKQDASTALQGLGQAIGNAQSTIDSRSAIELAGWHLQQARSWQTAAGDKHTAGRYDTCQENVRIALFHVGLALEVSAEYSTQLARLKASTAPEAGAPGDTTGGAENTSAPQYCALDGDEAPKAARQIRRLTLNLARGLAARDALITGKHDDFVEAQPLFDEARKYLEQAEKSDNWFDAYDIAWDGLYFVNLGLQLTHLYLESKGAQLPLADAAWDTPEPEGSSNDGDDEEDDSLDYNDAQTAMTDGVTDALRARLALDAPGNKPAIADYHLSCATDHIDQSIKDYWDEDWDEAVGSGDQAYFHANLAFEAVTVYRKELGLLAASQPSTVDNDLDAPPQGGYCGHDDEDIQAALNQWRELVVVMAKVQAFYDARCSTYADGLARLQSAREEIEEAEGSENWDDVSPHLEDAQSDVDLAFETAKAYIAGRQDQHPDRQQA